MVVNFHSSFKLNGRSFSSEEDLLTYVQQISDSMYQFVLNWFSNTDFVEVKTSGSTGTPKVLKLKKQFMVQSAIATGNFFNLQENISALLCLSTDYIAGKMMLVRALTLGWSLDVVEPTSKVSIDRSYDFSAMVPIQLQYSLANITKIKKLIIGGGVASKELIEQIKGMSTEVFATYGMTETVTHIAVRKLNNCTDFEQKYYRILPNISICVDQRSCLCITAPKLSEEFIKTNDVVQLISDTHFQWLGRFDNVINSGGIKLQPEVIEQKLSAVIDTRFFVTGIPDEILGEKLVLVIEGKPREVHLDKAFLSKFEKPKNMYFVDHFVETKTKKIQRIQTLQLI